MKNKKYKKYNMYLMCQYWHTLQDRQKCPYFASVVSDAKLSALHRLGVLCARLCGPWHSITHFRALSPDARPKYKGVGWVCPQDLPGAGNLSPTG